MAALLRSARNSFSKPRRPRCASSRKKGVSSFYEGELAEKIAAFSAECGGAMTRADLASYRPGMGDADLQAVSRL